MCKRGDDISKPNRVSTIVSEWQKEKFIALYSNYDTINNDGELISTDVDDSDSGRLEYVFGNSRFFTGGYRPLAIAGCSSAFSNQFLRSLPRPAEKIFCEDALLSYVISAQQLEIRKIHQSLLFYRVGAGSVTGVKGARTIAELETSEVRRAILSASNNAMYGYLLSFLEENTTAADELVVRRLRGLYRFTSYAAKFWDLNPFERFIQSLRHGYPNGFLFFLPRCLGRTIFLFLKKLASINAAS